MADKIQLINVADIVDPETGKTDRELNMEKVHDIPLKSLVECDETGLRLYVAIFTARTRTLVFTTRILLP